MNGTTEITLRRLSDNGITTLGEFKFGRNTILSLEDDFDDVKVHGETRIPEGRYEIRLRTEGRFHESFKAKYSFHRGMLHLQDVPNYEYILIHPGNTAKDTEGCIITGNKKVNENYVSGSTFAYLFFYGYVIAAFDRGERVYLNIIDNPR